MGFGKHRRLSATLGALIAACVSNTVSATIIEADDYNRDSPYTVATNDLLQASATLTSTAGNFQQESSAGVTVLTDGIFGIPNFSSSATGGNNGGTLLIYTLDMAASPAGYTISNINVFGGWQDPGRDQQSYTVAYSTVLTPDTYTDITTVNFSPPLSGGVGSAPVYTSVAISSDSGPLADNVSKVRFTFNASENGYCGYRELDVIGTAVPEPGSLALLGLTALGLVRRRR